MKTAADTSVLLDVFAGDSTFGPASSEALRRAYDSGSLLACDVVWSEVRAHFESDGAFDAEMESLWELANNNRLRKHRLSPDRVAPQQPSGGACLG